MTANTSILDEDDLKLLHGLSQGKPQKQMARELGVARETISRIRLPKLYRKMNVPPGSPSFRAAQALILAVRRGLL